MLEAIENLESDQRINALEADTARQAQAAGTKSHTIGYEVEIYPSATSEVPVLEEATELKPELKAEYVDALLSYGYTLGEDAVYELSSPSAKHPLALVVASRGIERIGWLPREAKGLVTAHVSIGSSENKLLRETSVTYRLINLLRAVDIAGGTTPGRLLAPVGGAEAMEKDDDRDTSLFSWNKRGIAGVAVSFNTEDTQWHGKNKRVEFRTMRYQSLEQFGLSLESLYFLSRGLLAGESNPASNLYNQFEDWFRDYQQANGLPNIELNPDLLEDFDFTEPKALAEYIEPYADHLTSPSVDKKPLHDRINQTVTDLAEEFGMARIPTQLSR
jgi:hypothetical protein